MPRKLRNIELNRLSVDEFKKSPKWPVRVVMDNVRSMLNVGSLFRTCDAFNVEGVYLCGITPAPPHREISKTAIGAELAVTWSYINNTLDIVNEMKQEGWKIFAVEQTVESIELNQWTPSIDEKIALVFGHEIDGVSQDVIEACHGVIEIPQFGTKHSLNVSVSAGVVIWQSIQRFLSVNSNG